jgi:hypothetical protein
VALLDRVSRVLSEADVSAHGERASDGLRHPNSTGEVRLERTRFDEHRHCTFMKP